MKLYKEYNNFFITPCIKIYYDTYFEGGLICLDLEFTWLMWTVSFSIIKESI